MTDWEIGWLEALMSLYIVHCTLYSVHCSLFVVLITAETEPMCFRDLPVGTCKIDRVLRHNEFSAALHVSCGGLAVQRSCYAWKVPWYVRVTFFLA